MSMTESQVGPMHYSQLTKLIDENATLSRQLAEAQQRSDYQYLKTTMQHEIEKLKLELAEARGVIERAMTALKPFAAAVFNYNGDMTVSSVSDREAYIKAYFVYRALSSRDKNARTAEAYDLSRVKEKPEQEGGWALGELMLSGPIQCDKCKTIYRPGERHACAPTAAMETEK